MSSVIFRTTARLLMPMLIMLSVFLFLRGHNDPGGGFVGGLVAASAWVLYALAYGTADARRALRVDPRDLTAIGLLVSLASGLVPVLRGLPFLTGTWGYITIPGSGQLDVGTPVFFDVGVYLVVLGVTLMIIFALAEEA